MILKKISTVIIMLFLLLAVTGYAMAATVPIRVFVDGTEVQFTDQKPYINADNRTLVPVRFVSEALGAEVDWIALTRTVKINYNGKLILLEIGIKKATVGTSLVTLDTAPAITNDRTMVPLRFVSECLGAQVEWNGQARAIYITTGAAEPLPEAKPFIGTPTTDNTLSFSKPADKIEPGSLYMYVTADQLPIKFGETTIYNIDPGDEVIAVKQARFDRYAVQMLIIQNDVVIGGRTGKTYPTNHFTALYNTRNIVDEALGTPRVEINKVNAFVFCTIKNAQQLYLIVDNPLNAAEWQP